MTHPAETAILDLLAATPEGKSIDPADVARVLQPEQWQRALPRVKEAAKALARAGTIVILRHNKPADPDTFKGVWRIRRP